MQGTPSTREKTITSSTSPRGKEEKRKSRQSIPKIREKSASDLAQKLGMPDITDFVSLTQKQEEKLAAGDLLLKDLKGKQKAQYKRFERKVTERIPDLLQPGPDNGTAPRSRTIEAKRSPLASPREVRGGTLNIALDPAEQGLLTPKGKSSPRHRNQTPRVVIPKQMEILTAELKEPVNPRLKRLDRKLSLGRKKIAGLELQLQAEKASQNLRQDKRDALAKEEERSDTSSSIDASALVNELAQRHRRDQQ